MNKTAIDGATAQAVNSAGNDKPAKPEKDGTERVAPITANELSGDAAESFPIVGIGASAGGLEALEQFLSHVPGNSGAAFVVIQHLDPTRENMIPEILQRSTPMKVTQAKDRARVRPNCVYVIPPNKDIALLHGKLHLLEPASPRGQRLPIDYFFRSLAEDQRQRSVGVILSGMGTDGTLGLKAIKEMAGVVLVQEPDSAKFAGMPRSAIEAGLADFVAPPDELPALLLNFFHHTVSIALPQAITEADSTQAAAQSAAQSALEKIILLLRAHSGHDFSLYKKSTLYRRIERRMGIHQIEKIPHYVRFLQENSQEQDLLFKELLIGVTSFFRDPPAWQKLKEQVLPALLANYPEGGQLRAWTPGCSTGEEAYSLGIVFKEMLEQINPPGRYQLQIFATDLDKDAIAKARQGSYLANIAADVSAERLKRFFSEETGGYCVNKEIREMVVFAPQDVIMDPPFTRLDILICRNLLIYLAAELQTRLLPLFQYSLNPSGVLFLGSAETVSGFSELFNTLDSKWKIYRRKEATAKKGSDGREYRLDFPASFSHPAYLPKTGSPEPAINFQTLAEQALLQRLSPPAVLVNGAGDILYVNGRTGKYLEPAAGKANWNIFVMIREGLRHEFANAFQKAKSQVEVVSVKGLKVKTGDDEENITLTVQALEQPEALRGLLMVAFNEDHVEPVASRKKSKTARRASPQNTHLVEMEQELRQVYQELHTAREEMQTSQEELRSTNEELQSANEELQSTNEELTTSKEELQSLNEEMQTINAELQSKVDELSRANNDMKNLLNSTAIATLFLDGALHIRNFTPQVTKIIKLIASDVGRPVTDLVNDLVYPSLAEDVNEVLRTLVFSEKPIATHDGRWYTVRIMPYRTLENHIDGVVITFNDITVSRTLEIELRQARDQLELRLRQQTSKLTQESPPESPIEGD